MRTGRIPLVSSLGAAISYVSLDAADHRLDCEHYPRLHQLALARTWASVGAASCLGYAAGIRMPGNSCCNYGFAPDQQIGCPYNGQRARRVKPTALLTILCTHKALLPSELNVKTELSAALQAHSFLQA